MLVQSTIASMGQRNQAQKVSFCPDDTITEGIIF